MPTFFIFHGTSGYPEENWFPWLKKELEELGHKVIVPQFPTPQNQSLESWFRVLDQYKAELSPDTILIGHSLGGTFLLRVLEKLRQPVRAVFIVSAPVGIMPIKNRVSDQPFILKRFNWEKIRKNACNFFVFHSDNDPYVGIGNGEETAKRLGVRLIFVPNAGHFNKAAGYTKFSLLLEKINKL
ncbi:Serine hydrolase [uncultured archaeon]|nr:Serine hydrolase [uncultured archaeon]